MSFWGWLLVQVSHLRIPRFLPNQLTNGLRDKDTSNEDYRDIDSDTQD